MPQRKPCKDTCILIRNMIKLLLLLSMDSNSFTFSLFTHSKKVKSLILGHSEWVLDRPVGLMRLFQTEKFRALLRVAENPNWKTTRHWLWRMKDIPHTVHSWTQASAGAARTRTQATTAISSLFNFPCALIFNYPWWNLFFYLSMTVNSVDKLCNWPCIHVEWARLYTCSYMN